MFCWYRRWHLGQLMRFRHKIILYTYSKTCLKRPLKKKTKLGFQDRLSLNAGQKYCRMLQREHSAIIWTFIKLPFVFKTFVLSIFEWLLKTSFTVYAQLSSRARGLMHGSRKFCQRGSNLISRPSSAHQQNTI